MNKNKYTLNLPKADIVYVSNFYTLSQANLLLSALTKDVAWEQDYIKMFGKTHAVPRLQAFYANEGLNYSYSNIKLTTKNWTTILLDIKGQVENYCEQLFNSVLINLYRHGQDSNGWHADDEPELGVNPVIASLSFGATRSFHLKSKNDKTIKQKIALENGSLLLMKGSTQHFYYHQLSKTAKKVGKRVNLTFRNIS